MNQDTSRKLWRYTELPDCPNNNEATIRMPKGDNKKMNLILGTDAIQCVNTGPKTNKKTIATTATAVSNLQDKHPIMLKDIRLLKFHVYKPKTCQTDQNQSVLKNKSPMLQVATDNISHSSKPEAAVKCSTIKVGKVVSTQSRVEANFIGPSDRWAYIPKSYKGARKSVQMPLLCTDTTDGETSGMGSSVDDVVESSTESEATASFPPPIASSSRSFPPPAKIFQKRRGGWPKGRKRNTNTVLAKNTYPKSATTPYGYFLIERHKLYQNIEPNIPITFLSKILGAEWKHLTEEEKKKYNIQSEKDNQRYRNELKTYRLSSAGQLVLRKKRAKTSSMKEKKIIGEESSDCTDEVDDEENRDLFCRTCDQWFTSLHNKREHLYGRYHLQALKGGQPKLWKSKRKSTVVKSVTFAGSEKLSKDTISLIKSESEDDVAMSTGDELASKSDCQSYRESTTEDEDDSHSQASLPDTVDDSLQAVVSKVYDREHEIQWLTENLKRAQCYQELLNCSLSSLEKRRQELQHEQQLYAATSLKLRRELHCLWKLPLAIDTGLDPQPNVEVEAAAETGKLLAVNSDFRAATPVLEEADPYSFPLDRLCFSGSDIDNLDPDTDLDLDNFSTSIFDDGIDLNLFPNDFFIDIEDLKENDGDGT